MVSSIVVPSALSRVSTAQSRWRLPGSSEALAHDLLAGLDPAGLARCQSVLGAVQQRLPEVVAARTAATPPPARPRPGNPQTRS